MKWERDQHGDMTASFGDNLRLDVWAEFEGSDDESYYWMDFTAVEDDWDEPNRPDATFCRKKIGKSEDLTWDEATKEAEKWAWEKLKGWLDQVLEKP